LAESLSLLERLEQRAAPSGPAIPHHALNYNYPLAWYRRPDGDIVQLQSDPNNRAMYEDLGFVILRPNEVQEWEQEVRPEVVAKQKRKAQLITGIRSLIARHPQMALLDDDNFGLRDLEIEELEQEFNQLCEQAGYKPRLPRIPPEKPPTKEQLLAGVETSASHTQEELASKLQRGEGYDPIDEARRRRR
jgi:hypothetical protein